MQRLHETKRNHALVERVTSNSGKQFQGFWWFLSFTGPHFDLIDCILVGLSVGFRFACFNPHIKVNPGSSHARHWHKMYTEPRLVDISITGRMERYGISINNHYGATWVSRSLTLLFETILHYQINESSY